MSHTFRPAALHIRIGATYNGCRWTVLEDDDGEIFSTDEFFASYSEAQQRADELNRNLRASLLLDLY